MNLIFRLQYFPVLFFSIIMGLAGFVLSIQRAESIFNAEHVLSTYILYGVVIIFIAISLLYLLKIVYHFPSVVEEINNPVKLSFFPSFSISLLLLSVAFLEANIYISRYLWIIGTVIHFVAIIAILSAWMHQTKFEIHHFNPAWFIPIVGNILVPIAGTRHFEAEISWFFFSIGIVFWILLFTIFLYRIIFHNPMPEKLSPTFFILIAPPAVGFTSYVKLAGSIDNFAKVLYYFALFLTILLLTQFKIFYRIRFYLSWWAYSFPVASITMATYLMYNQTGLAFFKPLFFVLLLLLTLFIAMLLIYTLKAIADGEVCIKEE